MIELVAPDLKWMSKVHRPADGVLSPTQLIQTRDPNGAVLIPEPYGLCVRGGVAACVHRGLLPGVPAAASGGLAAWCVQNFFETVGLQPVQLLTLDGLQRMVRDAPKAVVTVCAKCGGKGVDPDVKADDEGLRPACPVCDGDTRTWDMETALVAVGPVKVVLSELVPFLPHLGGANVGLGVAPRVGVPGASDLHVRHVVEAAGSTGGEWRVTLLGF
jgi:hypothetical protein